VGLAAAQLCGEDFLIGLDRHRTDLAGQVLTPAPGLASTTAVGLADCTPPALDLLGRVAPERALALIESVTVDVDTTDVEVYGRLKQGVGFNHQGQRVGRPHVATWAEAAGGTTRARRRRRCWVVRWPAPSSTRCLVPTGAPRP